jgi:iron complex outermembrane receptor protein
MEYTERGGYLQEALEIGFGTITNTTTYRDLTSDNHINVSSVAALPGATLGLKCFATFKCLDDYQVVQPSQSASNELLFSSKQLGRISFVAGLFAYEEKARGSYSGNNYPGSSTPGGLLFFAYHVNTDSYAAFASADYNITDQLHLTVGARYTDDTKKEPENLVGTTTTERRVSPRAAVRYDWTEGFNTYFTYSTGFRSGVYTSAFKQPALKPETLKSYEVGAKYEGRNLRLNLSGFHYDYTDLQLSTFTGVTAVAANASATLDGVDFDGEVRLNDNFKLRGGGSYLPKAQYNDYQNAVAFVVSPGLPVRQYDGTANCGGYCGVSQQSVDASGARMIKAPRFTGFAAVNYENTVWGGAVSANLSAYYTSSINYDVVGIVQSKSYVTLDGEASYSPASLPEFKLGIFATNLNNAKWKNGFLISAAGYARYFSPPPQVGFRVGYSF